MPAPPAGDRAKALVRVDENQHEGVRALVDPTKSSSGVVNLDVDDDERLLRLDGLDEVEIEGLGMGDDRNVMRARLSRQTPDRLLVVGQARHCRVTH